MSFKKRKVYWEILARKKAPGASTEVGSLVPSLGVR